MKLKLLYCLLITCFFSLNLIGQSVTFDEVLPANSTGANPWAIASGLLDGDEFLDIVVGTDASTVEVFINLSDGTGGILDGTFAPGVTLTAEAPNDLLFVEGIAIGDLNGDMINDIVATSYSRNNVVWFQGNGVDGSGDGTFQDAIEISEGLDGAGAVELADLDNNGALDIIVSNYGPGVNTDSVVYFLGNVDINGDPDATFGVKRFIVDEAAGLGPVEFAVGKFDNADGLDEDIDVVVTFLDNGEVIVYDNQFQELGLVGGDVPFQAYTTVDTVTGTLFNSVSFADVDNAGGLEILVSNNQPGAGNPNIAWYSYDDSDGAGNPLITTSWSETNITTSITRTATATLADFDVDGDNDLIVTNGRSTDVDIIWFESDGTGGFIGGTGTETEYVINDTNPAIFDLEIQDFDNDGDLDIASISYLSAKLSVFLNDRFTLGVDEQSIESIGIYPNPVTNQLHFKGTFNSDLEVSVYDVLGKRIINNTIKFGESLDVSKLNNGLYIIKFVGYNDTYKFVKK
jgi:hypothetical protein